MHPQLIRNPPPDHLISQFRRVSDSGDNRLLMINSTVIVAIDVVKDCLTKMDDLQISINDIQARVSSTKEMLLSYERVLRGMQTATEPNLLLGSLDYRGRIVEQMTSSQSRILLLAASLSGIGRNKSTAKISSLPRSRTFLTTFAFF
jgi:hypothetical protein